MCLINGTAPRKRGSSVMLPACQHSTLASVGRYRQSAGTQLETAWWERGRLLQPQSFPLLLPQGSFHVHSRSTCHSVFTDPVCGFPSLCNSEDHSFSYIAIHQSVLTSCLKGKVPSFSSGCACVLGAGHSL